MMANLAHYNPPYGSVGDYNNGGLLPQNGIQPASNGEADKVAEQHEPETNVDILIRNVVCSFSLRCHLNLKKIALNGWNVEYKRETGMVTMKLRNPFSTASIWSSGKVTCTGTQTEEAAKKASRKFARILQKLGFRVRFSNYRVVNVLGTCSLPFGIKLMPLAQENKDISYEPEIHPGATYKIKELKATLKIFSTGSITVTAPCVQNVQLAIEQVYPFVYPYRRDKSAAEEAKKAARNKQQQQQQIGRRNRQQQPLSKRPRYDNDDLSEEDEDFSDEESEEDDFDSEESLE